MRTVPKMTSSAPEALRFAATHPEWSAFATLRLDTDTAIVQTAFPFGLVLGADENVDVIVCLLQETREKKGPEEAGPSGQ